MPPSDTHAVSDPLLEGLQSVSSQLSQYPMELNAITLTVLKSILHGFGLSNVILFQSKQGKGRFQAISGLGPLANGLVNKLGFAETGKDALAIASVSEQPILFESLDDRSLRMHLPSWLIALNPGGVLMASVPSEPSPLALIVGFSYTGTPLRCDTVSLQRLNALRLSLAIALRKAPQG